MCLLSADKPFCSEGFRTHRTDKSYTLLSKCKHAVHVRPHRPTPPMPSYIGEQCFTPFAFLMGYGQMLHCIPHQSVKLRSIALRRKRVSAEHGTLLRPARGKDVLLHVHSMPFHLLPRTFHLLPFTLRVVPFHSVSIPGFFMALCAIAKPSIPPPLHSSPHPFVYHKAMPSVIW